MTDIQNALRQAKKILMEYWPLQSFIATNPLWGLHDQPFFEVASRPWFNSLMEMDYYQTQYQQNNISKDKLKQAFKEIENQTPSDTELDAWIETSLKQTPAPKIRLLLSRQFEQYQFQKPSIWIKEKLFALLRDYFGTKQYQQANLLTFWQSQLDTSLYKETLSQNTDLAIAKLLENLRIPKELTENYLKAIYLQVYGWSSLMHWRNQHTDNPWLPGSEPCESILLIWLYYENIMASETQMTYQPELAKHSISSHVTQAKQCYIWQTAFELTYLDQLSQKFNKPTKQDENIVDAQFIFCIDTRSEGFRRHLEVEGNFQTFGFAGFFGALFNLNCSGEMTYQAPALVKASDTLVAHKKTSKHSKFLNNITSMIQNTKKQLGAPFALFEIIGFWFSFFMIFKTFQPKLNSKHQNTLSVENTLTEETQFQAAQNLLKTIGLTEKFSKWVLICAHQSNNINNPFKASLNCGACGGNSGIPNALVMCDILNNVDIRKKLSTVGIHIPMASQFIPACHHTDYDQLEILKGNIPSNLQIEINRAAKQLQHEKRQSLPGTNPLSQRSQNWSELIPELGLINNTAIIIGPRRLTKHQNLGRRTFLHCYEPELDPTGEILTSILSAPAIVAHWINAQYYFSTTNPTLFGAGNKAIHNVLPGVGVLEGNLSDLKIGLPTQSTHFQSKPMHEPKRLTVVVYAQKATLNQAIEQSPDFKMLLDNQWIYLKHLENTRPA